MFKVFLFLLFVNTSCFAQGSNVKGIVFADGQRKSSAKLTNINSSLRKISDLKGEFEIFINCGDTLVTALQGFALDTTIFTNQNYLGINLIPSAIALKEVNITAEHISAAAKYAKLKYEYREINRKGDVKNMVVVSPLGIGVKVDKLYNGLSKEGRNARKLQDILEQGYQNNVIDDKFKKSLVAKLINLSGKELEKFMIDFRPSFELVENMSEFEIANYILERFKKDDQR